MAAVEVFAMNNPNSTCTAASLTWCYMLLARTATPAAALFLPSDPTLARNMDNIKDQDHDPANQVALMGMQIVSTRASVLSSTEITEAFKNHAPHVGIFWNSFHTVGYSYAHLDKHYFDNNVGLWKAKKTADLVAKMESIRTGNSYGSWAGYAVLKLAERFKLPKIK